MGIKDFARRKVDEIKREHRERKVFKKQLKQKVKVARRKAYGEEAVKQAELKARIRAKQRFNPAPKPKGTGGGMTPEARAILFGGTPQFPMETKVKQAVRKKIRKKRKKSRKVVKRAIRQAQAKPKTESFQEMFDRL